MAGSALRVNPRSLRYRALGVALAVALLPVVWIPVARLVEGALILPVQDTLLHVAAQAAIDSDDLDAVSRTHQVRLRVLDPGGAVAFDADRDLLRPVTGPVLRLGGLPDDRTFDEALGPLDLRPEVAEARAGGVGSRCQRAEHNLVCAVARARPDGAVVHVQRVTARFLTPLFEQRLGLAALAVGAAGFGGALALWIGLRMVRPLESLRDQVVARTRGRVSTEPVEISARDEVGEVAEAFNELLAALEARSRANEAFAADLAHELKNPVAAVRAAAEVLAADRELDPERRGRLQRVLAESSARMEAELTRFLDLARAEAGLRAAPRDPVDLAALVRAVADGLADDPRFADRRFAVEGDPGEVRAVPERLEAAVRNLLVNGAAFAGPGGEVRASVWADGDQLRLEVRDTGPGIDAAELPQVFERYHSRREGGTGIGLALTRAIVEAHGGTIEVRSPAGSGAVFTVHLPRSPGSPSGSVPRSVRPG